VSAARRCSMGERDSRPENRAGPFRCTLAGTSFPSSAAPTSLPILALRRTVLRTGRRQARRILVVVRSTTVAEGDSGRLGAERDEGTKSHLGRT
jgi:hypothetical protein